MLMHAFPLPPIYPDPVLLAWLGFWLMCLLEPYICLAMLSMLCRWSGLRTRAIHECSMIGQMGMMYSGDGNEMVWDVLNMFRLGWSTLGMFSKPILADLGPEFLSLDPRWACNHSWAYTGQPYRLTNLLRSLHELPSSGFPFDIRIKRLRSGAYI